MQKPSLSIISNIMDGISECRIYIFLDLVFLVFSTILGYFSLTYSFAMSNEILKNDRQAIIVLLVYSAVLSLASTIFRQSVRRLRSKVEINLSVHLRKKFISMLVKSDLEFLDERKCGEDYSAIDKGINAAVSTYSNAFEILSTFFMAISTIMAVITKVGLVGWPTFFSMSILLLVGIKLMKTNYQERKKIEKKLNPIQTCLTYLAGDIFSSVLNGQDSALVTKLVDSSQKRMIITTKQQNYASMKYSILEVIHSFVVVFNMIWIIYIIDNLVMIVPIHLCINQACNTMWRLFHQFHYLAQNASSWASLEEIIKVVILKNEGTIPIPPRNPLIALCETMDIEFDSKFREFKLEAESAGGKTTFLKKIAIKLLVKYGSIFKFMEQKKNIIKSNDMTVFEYLTLGLHDWQLHDHREKIIENILMLCKKMNISDHVVNRDTLIKPFEKPSGGEENRIGFLQTILPIYLGISLDHDIPKILLIDEATSGLDENTFLLVRNIFDELRDTYNIILVVVDHHTTDDSKVTKLDVHKKEMPKKLICMPTVPSTSMFDSLIEFAIGNKSKDKKDSKELDEKNQKPEVWVTLAK